MELDAISEKTPPLRFLVADDVPVQRFLVIKEIKSIFENALITESEDGDHACELCENNKFDICVLDYNMPGKNGIEVSRAILKQNPTAHIVLFSAKSLEEISTAEKIKGLEIPKSLTFFQKDTVALREHFRLFASRNNK